MDEFSSEVEWWEEAAQMGGLDLDVPGLAWDFTVTLVVTKWV